jgi:hypothetical protein
VKGKKQRAKGKTLKFPEGFDSSTLELESLS